MYIRDQKKLFSWMKIPFLVLVISMIFLINLSIGQSALYELERSEINKPVTSPDNSEQNRITECNDGLENDYDGKIDYPKDKGCSSPLDTTETDPKNQCDDGINNDYDKFIDWPADPGCRNYYQGDLSELTNRMCDDGFDNDGDGLKDMKDGGCETPYDNDEVVIPQPGQSFSKKFVAPKTTFKADNAHDAGKRFDWLTLGSCDKCKNTLTFTNVPTGKYIIKMRLGYVRQTNEIVKIDYPTGSLTIPDQKDSSSSRFFITVSRTFEVRVGGMVLVHGPDNGQGDFSVQMKWATLVRLGDVEPVCGNGYVEGIEKCDRGADNGVPCAAEYDSSCSYCNANCETLTKNGGFCGDGVVNGPEECDDGNLKSGDGCSSECLKEQKCTDDDGDSFSVEGGNCGPVDCDDDNENVNPGAVEVCDGLDNDCDGKTDEGIVCNRAPHINVDLTPENPTTLDDLSCIGTANDPDSDELTVTYEFTGDYVESGSATKVDGFYLAIIPNSQTKPKDLITCTMKVSDGSLDDTDSDSVIVQAKKCTDDDGDSFSVEGGNCGPEDCNDDNEDVYPGAVEVCDGIDNDCDVFVDEGCDVCPPAGVEQCDLGFCTEMCPCHEGQGDCDSDAECKQGLSCVKNVGPIVGCQKFVDICLDLKGGCEDNDQDGFDGFDTVRCSTGNDCDDNNEDVNPGAVEVCNGLDDDCDGVVDEGNVCGIECVDGDGDGYNVTGNGCGVVDCDDNNENVHPEATEVCDSIDNNCNGLVDEGKVCGQLEIHVDLTPDIPLETDDLLCIGTVLGSITGTIQVSFEFRGGYSETGNAFCYGDVCFAVVSKTETSLGEIITCEMTVFENGVNVDASADSVLIGGKKMICQDNDNDGYLGFNQVTCPQGTDCNDDNKNINPGAAEVCNGIDDDCDTAVDEGGVCTGECTDDDGDGFSVEGGNCGRVDCNDDNENVNPGADEVCDGLDNDCDNLVDEGNVCEQCGNGVVKGSEECDDGLNNGVPCVPDYNGVCMFCETDCTLAEIVGSFCGDGVMDGGFESCDGDDWGTVSGCEDIDDFVGGQLSCDDICDFNTTRCVLPECEDGVDNDGDSLVDFPEDPGCDSKTDNDETEDECTDNDSDGFSVQGGICGSVDCDDNNNDVHPGATEVCDGLDNNCNGLVDEGINCGPSVTIHSPESIVYFTQDILVNITATDPDGKDDIENVWFNFNGTNILFNEPFVQRFENNRVYTLRAFALDKSGNLATDEVTFTIRKPIPTREELGLTVKNELTILKVIIEDSEQFIIPGDLGIFMTIKNTGDFYNNHLRISVSIPELGIWKFTREFDLDSGEQVNKKIIMPVNYGSEGLYDVRITISNSDVRRIIYRELKVRKGGILRLDKYY